MAGFFIRASLRRFESGDAACDLLPWYHQISEGGGLRSLGKQVGNYNMLYQFLIAVMTYLPIKPLYAYKILSCVCDYLLALAAAWSVYNFPKEVYSYETRKWRAIIAYAMIVLSPIVFLNSAQWAQCDSIYTFFGLIAFIALCDEKYARAFIFYGVATAFKLQAIFAMPFFLLVYFVKKKFSIFYFFIIPTTMCVVSIPCLFMGRKISEIFSLYFNQTNEHGSISMNYPSFWVILNNEAMAEGYGLYKDVAIVFTVCVLAGWMISLIVSQINFDNRSMLYMVFLLVYTCVLFLPAMHERYGYIYEILSILILFYNKRTLLLLISLHGISLMTYGFYLNGSSINMSILAVINLAVYVGYAIILMKQLMENKKEKLMVEA